MIDWKKKLTSRKFWLEIVAFITPLLLAFGVAESEVAQVTAIIMAGADVLAYIMPRAWWMLRTQLHNEESLPGVVPGRDFRSSFRSSFGFHTRNYYSQQNKNAQRNAVSRSQIYISVG